MRVVVDTNVFVSLLIRPGDTFVALAEFLDQNATVLYSADTLTELIDVLRRQKFARYTTAEEAAAFVEWLAAEGELVAVDRDVSGSRDPADDKFLALSVAGKAEYLVTGDKDLLVLKKIGAALIVSPSEFLARVDRPRSNS
jgi:uncharacterized protein